MLMSRTSAGRGRPRQQARGPPGPESRSSRSSPVRDERARRTIPMTASRRLAATALTVLAAILYAGLAQAETTRVTFLLVNDIYLASDQMMADGQRRGGFARLSAVVKAERAKGGHVVFAHGGDTLSPSLMSGLDRGAHIVALTNMMPPDIF